MLLSATNTTTTGSDNAKRGASNVTNRKHPIEEKAMARDSSEPEIDSRGTTEEAKQARSQ